MTFDPKSISEQIDCLARLTGAPPAFVDQVKALFTTKGISFDEDATPYLKALEDAFRREETIRANAHSARQNVDRLREKFSKLGTAYALKLSRIRPGGKQIQSSTHRMREKLFKSDETGITRVVVPDGHRAHVMPPQKDTLPMVPGPKEPQ